MTISLDRLPSRVVIASVSPEIDGGSFAIKRTVGESVEINADIIADGHEVLSAMLLYRRAGESAWHERKMAQHPNDRWSAAFALTRLGEYEYTVTAWIDRFATWRRDLEKKVGAGQDVASELLEGTDMVAITAQQTSGAERDYLLNQVQGIQACGAGEGKIAILLDPHLHNLMAARADRSLASTYDRVLRVRVDPIYARYAAWYEFFPRSAANEPGRHGNLNDVQEKLDLVSRMGFNVLYLPPIHPIGISFRKGPNNTLNAGPNDPGSPWAIGGAEGGHTALHPQLGTLHDFDSLLAKAQTVGIEVAMDIAFQCSPDHPYVREHPQWFRQRPDGTIKYAENPPKKYQDIYPLDFECNDWQSLWNELLGVVMFWADRGVHVFRVDNPHTKPFRFWHWLIAEVKSKHPEAVFLAEAFTRPKVMKYLAKVGFSQSYTYFTWRNTKHDLIEYFTELTQSEVREYFRPNLFANTPDILPEFLQHSGPNGFRIRFVLAATLGATYGVYSPPYESFIAAAVPDKEEYADSEKYQITHWDWQNPTVFREFMTLVNRIRRENAALHFDHRLKFYTIENDRMLFYGKTTADLSNIILVVVNLDPHHTQSAWLHVPLEQLGIGETESYQVHDLITNAHFIWQGSRNFVQIDPGVSAHVLRLRKRVRSEQDFDYFM